MRTVKKPPPHPVYPIEDLRDLVIQASQRYAGRAALKSKKLGVYCGLDYAELARQVVELGTACLELGLVKGDRVAVLSENRTEWALSYLAAVTSGLVAVPLDRDLSPSEIRHVISVSQPKLLLCSETYWDQLSEYRRDLSSLERVISMEEERGEADMSLAEALDRGQQELNRGSTRYEDSRPSREDAAAIIFTSGTTGVSKGVILTHGNLVSNVMAISQYVAIHQGVVLSVLPLHHTYECTAGLLVALYQGCTICHAESLRRIPDNLCETKATVLLGVPLLFENLYRRIESAAEEKGRKRFRLAKGIAGLAEGLFRVNMRRRIFKQVHQKLGGHMGLFISGGAAVNPKVAKGFRELGINFIQGYGMTEASPIISVNRVDCLKDDSVGLPLPGLEVKIIDDEILVRGPSVMRGYYLNDVATGETLMEDWLHTGDLGFLDEDGFLYISGRRKSLIVTANGKNIYPEEIEALLNESPYILESLVWGGPEEDPSKTEVQAVIVPFREAFDKEFGPVQYDEKNIYEVISKEVKIKCKRLSPHKRVRKIVLRSEEFEKTTTRKIKRFLYTVKPREVATG